jgi:predicted RNA-binding protein with RPS1 domain/tetratricopeptide (TPR) repeat protein
MNKKISGFDLVSKILTHPKGGVKELIGLANNSEQQWLEVKGDVKTEIMVWEAIRAILGIANTSGGILIIGLDDQKLSPTGISSFDPNGKIDSSEDEYFRTFLIPKVLKKEKGWIEERRKGPFNWVLDKENFSKFEKVLEKQAICDFGDEKVLVILIRPALELDTLVHINQYDYTKKSKSDPHGAFIMEVTFKREEGFGQTTKLFNYKDIHHHHTTYEYEKGEYASLLVKFEEEIEKKSVVQHNLPNPDYSETGFVGRKDDLETLIKILKGRSSVISIISEGGNGKTSLARKLAEQFCEDVEKSFDHIIWTTSKQSELTIDGFREIENHIETSDGTFHSINQYIGNSYVSETEPIISFLRMHKVLLIIDNLENILDDNLENFLGDFLDDAPSSNSKVLITSRWVVGLNERRYNLSPLTNPDAVELLIKLGGVLSGKLFKHFTEADLSNYCTKMHNNPLYIKWFAYALMAGGEPDSILDKPDQLLHYCVNNVFDTLDDGSKVLLKIMLCNPSEHRVPILTYLSEEDDIQEHLSKLIASNMVARINKPQDTQYELNELAKEYLTNLSILTEEERFFYQKRYRDIIMFKEQLDVKGANNPYDYYSFRVSNENEMVVAILLRNALKKRRNNYFEACEYLDKAKLLDRNYSEIYKTEGIIESERGEYFRAEAAYQKAVQLSPDNPVLRVNYAEILSKFTDNNKEALKHLRVSEELTPDEFKVKLEIARVLMYSAEWSESKKYLDELLSTKITHDWDIRRLYNLVFGYYQRYSEYLIDSKSELESVLEQLFLLRSTYDKYCEHAKIDTKMRQLILKTRKQFNWIRGILQNDDPDIHDKEIAIELIDWFDEFTTGDLAPSDDLLRERLEEKAKAISTPFVETQIPFDVGDKLVARINGVNIEFGIFVEAFNIPGLIHKSELPGIMVSSLRKKYENGTEIDVEIISVDKVNNRFNAKPKKWFLPLDLVTGTVKELKAFGVIVQIDEFVTGLLHVSQMTKTFRRLFNNKELVPNIQVNTYILSTDHNSIKLSQINMDIIQKKK